MRFRGQYDNHITTAHAYAEHFVVYGGVTRRTRSVDTRAEYYVYGFILLGSWNGGISI